MCMKVVGASKSPTSLSPNLESNFIIKHNQLTLNLIWKFKLSFDEHGYII
jgi:hypothetical protein